MVAKKDEKTSLGSKILNYVPWRIALTAAAFAIPVAGPIVGTAVGALAYGNYRKNNKGESEKESAKPGRLKKFLFRACAIAIGFLFGGPIGAAIAGGIVAVDAVSNGKLIQGTEKVLDAGYDTLSAAGKGILNVEKAAFSKTKEAQELSERDIKPSYFPEVDSTTKTEGKNSSPSSSNPIVGEQTAKLAQDRESPAVKSKAR